MRPAHSYVAALAALAAAACADGGQQRVAFLDGARKDSWRPISHATIGRMTQCGARERSGCGLVVSHLPTSGRCDARTATLRGGGTPGGYWIQSHPRGR